MKKPQALVQGIIVLILPLLLGCQKDEKKEDQRDSLILGFSQIGAESAWRNCNTRSVQKAAAEAGIQLPPRGY
jgi:simple sugar transport system substrate-binding protein